MFPTVFFDLLRAAGSDGDRVAGISLQHGKLRVLYSKIGIIGLLALVIFPQLCWAQAGVNSPHTVRYTSSVPPASTAVSSWPGRFDPNAPDTWVPVERSTRAVAFDQPLDREAKSGPAHVPEERIQSGSAGALATGSSDHHPPDDPNDHDYYTKCPSQKNPLLATNADVKWPYADDSNHFVRAEGVMTEVGLSDEDAIYIHDSHDFDMKIDVYPIPEYQNLILDEQNLRVETESKYFNRRAVPSLGDHATVYGRWIFDCGHGPRTEIHPVAVFESDRQEKLALWAGGKVQSVSVVRINIQKNPGGPHYWLSLNGPFVFDVKLPTPLHNYVPTNKAIPFVRAIHGHMNTLKNVSFTLTGPPDTVQITFPDQPDDGYYELIIGFLDPADASAVNTSQITIDKIDVNYDHDPPPDFSGKGEWYMMANVNNVWRIIFWNTEVDDHDPTHYSDQLLDNPTIVVPGIPKYLQLSVLGYEDDDDENWVNLDPYRFFGGVGDIITHNTAGFWSVPIVNGKAISAHADWTLYFSVTPGGELPTIFEDKQYWEPRLGDEAIFSFNKLSVPLKDTELPKTNSRNDSYLLLDTSWRNDETKLLAPDAEDYYEFALDDFAKVTIKTTENTNYSIEDTDPWYDSMPQDLKNMFGYRSATVKVISGSPQTTDKKYNISIIREYLVLPPDWGETMDMQGGRIVDLATPDPKASVWPGSPEKRELTMDWAWQHVPGDVDTYQVLVPKEAGGVVFNCPWNRAPHLTISAPGMNITVPNANIVKNSWLDLKHPDQKVEVIIENPDVNHRGAYQLSAEWEGAKYYDPNECAAITSALTYVPTATADEYNRQTWKYWSDWRKGVAENDRVIHLSSGSAIDILISGEKGTAPSATARLYTTSGLLLGESAPLDKMLRTGIKAIPGLVPQSRLLVKNLSESKGFYILQVLPGRGATRTPVMLSAFSSEQ